MLRLQKAFLFFFGIALFAAPLLGKEITIEEAFDTLGIAWETQVNLREADTPENPFVPQPENFWHAVTDSSFDGVDALHVKMPINRDVGTSLTGIIQGPVRFSFWYKTNPDERTQPHYFFNNVDTGIGPSGKIMRSSEWVQATETIRETGNFLISFNVNGNAGDEPWEAWLDKFEILTEFPPEITTFPEQTSVPLGKSAKIQVTTNGFGDMTYKWFREDAEIPNEEDSFLILPAQSETGEETYNVEVTDQLGSAQSNIATVTYFDVGDALDNNSLDFIFADLQSDDYSTMLVGGAEAYDGEDAIRLFRCQRICDPGFYTTVSELSAEIQGPTLVSFWTHGSIGVTVDGQSPETRKTIYNGEWIQTLIALDDNEVHTVEWLSHFSPFSSQGILDGITLSRTPLILEIPDIQRKIEGKDDNLSYNYLSVGNTTHQLMKGDQVIIETTNEPISLKNLVSEDSGQFHIRLSNEFGEEAYSETFEISVTDGIIGDALEQPNLDWVTEGPDIWIAQIYETYDGEDAAALVPWKEPGVFSGSRLMTTISGPAYLTFWWKGGFFEVNDRQQVIAEDYGDWKQSSILLTSESNELKWRTDVLDRVQIDYLSDDPFRYWAFEKFEAETVILDFPAIRDGDRDYDGFSNLQEWALNKNLDFPNGTQAFKMVEVDGEQYLGITFSRPAELGSYSIYLEGTTDLTDWQKIDAVVSETYNAVNDTYTVTIRDIQAINEGAQFIRLVVSDEV